MFTFAQIVHMLLDRLIRVQRSPPVRSVVALALVLSVTGGGFAFADEEPRDRRAEPTVCDRPAGDPNPQQDPDAWRARDEQNRSCAAQREADQQANPAFQAKRDEVSRRMYGEALGDQLSDPTRPRATAPYLLPVNYYPGDPFRVPGDWAGEGRGRTRTVEFVASSGARLRGRLFAPSASVKGPYPGVVFTTGSLQGFNEAYNAFYEGLAEEGYLVLSYDVQGQGRSESLAHNADGTPTCCRGVPFQQDENFFQGARDALDFLFSTRSEPYVEHVAAAQGANADGTDLFNPWHAMFDRRRVGIAGHSYGAYAVSQVGQEDRRVDAIVGYDTLRPVTGDAAQTLHAPALSITAENLFTAQDPDNPPDRETNGSLESGEVPRQAYDQLRMAKVDTGLITQRSSSHNESSYGGSSQASRYGERTAFGWTLMWLDRYVKGDRRATARLLARRFDGSADRSSIGAGTYDEVSGQNVPYRIGGDCIADRVSIYFRSSLWLERGRHEVTDMRARSCR
jgi:dienelactone hydrolase